MRVIVCGGRDFSDTELVYKTLDRIHKERGITTVIEGDARGADRIGGFWARKNLIDNIKFPADWDTYGRRAGPIRNQKMLSEGKPDLVVAFRGGRGTEHMKSVTRGARIELIEVQ